MFRKIIEKVRFTEGLQSKVMLVLTRKIGEKVMIGDEISVTVLSLSGSHVRLGIDAPGKLDIHREEVYLKIQNDSQDSDLQHIIDQ